MNAKFNRYLAGAAFLAVSGAASACSSALISYQSAVISNLPVLAGNILAQFPECFGGGSTTSQVQINSTTFQQATAISGALTSRFMDSAPNQQASLITKSMAAGGQGSSWNAWGNIGSSDTRQSYVATNITTKNDNDILTTVLGADYALSPVMAVGVSAAFDRGDGAGSNSGALVVNKITSKGYTVAPYIGWQINKEFALDASVGFGKVSLACLVTSPQRLTAGLQRQNLTFKA